MSNISLDNPLLLLLMIPLAVLFVVPFAVVIRKDNINGHNIASGILHILMAVIIAFVAAGTSIVTTMTETDVYVVADVSYSANRNLDRVDGYIEDLNKSLPANSRLGVVCFGRDYKLTTHLGERFTTVKNRGVDDTATDILGALDYTGSLFRDNVIKRIVLITDGKQTNESDSNALKRQVDALADRKIHVDAIYLDDNISANAREVQLSGVRYNDTTSLNRTTTASVTVSCSCPEYATVDGKQVPYYTDAEFTITKNGEYYDRKSASLSRGSNSVSFTLDTSEEGTFEYEVTVSCKAGEDANDKNNKQTFTQVVSGKSRVLFIASSYDDYYALTDFYGNQAEIEARVGTRNVPFTVEELCEFDEIVISNIDVTELNDYEMFLASLDTVVSLFGKSLVTFGNTYVQTKPMGELKALGNMLPVTFGKTEGASKVYTLVFDTSYSMEQWYNLARAKTAAKELVNMLADDDRVAIVQFNGNAEPVIMPPAPLSNDRAKVLDAIEALDTAQSTDIGLGLEAAYQFMRDIEASKKNVMLFSDGRNGGNVNAALSPDRVATKMRAEGITVSTLFVGKGSMTATEANRAIALLNTVSRNGGGEYIDISTDENLEKALGGNETLNPDTTGGMSNVHLRRSADDVVKGMEPGAWNNAIVRNFYNAAFKNSGVTNVLTVDVTVNNEYRERPLYSYWNYGNGRVATFTGVMSGKISDKDNGSCIPDAHKATFYQLFRNALNVNIPAEKNNYPFVLDVQRGDGYATVTLTPEEVRADAKVEISVTSPDGNTVTRAMTFGSSAYTYTLVTPDVGSYKIDVSYQYKDNKPFTAFRALNIAYPSEYDSFTVFDAATLHKMIGANGIVSENGAFKIVNDEKEVGLYSVSLSMPLLIVCVVLYAVDIAVRKLKWEDIVSFFKRKGKVKKSR
ncbi:MAG: VWA domain-containing protein [Clostridia bacterium]|nr:VWA domain-containing protein [Clostridia bacterium]